MTHALLFATQAGPDGTPTALLPADGSTLLDRLTRQLEANGVEVVTVVVRSGLGPRLRAAGHRVVESEDTASDLAVIGAVIGGMDEGALVVGAADVLAHDGVIAKIAGPGVRRTLAAVQTERAATTGAFGQPVMRERDMVISVASTSHAVSRPNAVFRALFAVTDEDRPALRAAVQALRTEALDSGRDLDRTAGEFGAVGLALLGLVRGGTTVAAYNVRMLHCLRVDTPEAAAAATAALGKVDEAKVAVRLGIKEDDEFLATYLVNSYTPRLVKWFAGRGTTPTQVTWISIGIGVLAALAFASGARWLYPVGAVLLYFSFVFDCCDGQLARYTGNFSRYGGWLDMIADRAKEYLIFAGLAIGGVRHGQHEVWALALAAMIAQTVRHMVDTWYGALQDTATRALPVVPLDSRLDTLGMRDASSEGGRTIGATLGQLSARAHGRYRSPAYWLKRSVVLPIGDRWLLIAIAAALGGPRVTFIALLIAAGLAFGYVLAGRTLRARSMQVAVMPRFDIRTQRDDGVAAHYVIGRLAGGRFRPLPVIAPGLVATLATLAFAIGGHHGPRWLVVAIAALAQLAALAARAPHDGPLDWLTVAGLRAMEYTFVIVAGVLGGVPLPLVYALLGVLVIYHYDVTGRIEKQATPVRPILVLQALGWDMRIIALAGFVMLGWSDAAFAVSLGVIAVLFLGSALTGWLQRPKQRAVNPTRQATTAS